MGLKRERIAERSRKKRRVVLAYIKKRLATDGDSPTLREIAKDLHLSGFATAKVHVETLEKEGLLYKVGEKGRARALRVTEKGMAEGQE